MHGAERGVNRKFTDRHRIFTLAHHSGPRYSTRMDRNRLQEIDARALKLGLTMSLLAKAAKVAPATMAKLNRAPDTVRPRAVSKLEAKLSELEGDQ